MQYVEGFPKTMVHPGFTPAIISDAEVGTAQSYAGQPARFLPQMVHTPDEEQDMRARGYLNPGEAPAQVHHAEYPKILRHRHYAPAVKATQRSVVVRNKDTDESEIKIVDVPAREERFPDKIVGSSEEEEHWRNEGWAPAGTWDSEAFERAHSTPDVAYDPQEWPKWVPTGEVDENGKPIAVLMEDPDAVPATERDRLAHEYPKMVGGRVAKDAAEEAALANGGEAVLEVERPALTFHKVAAYVAPAAPQPVLDVAALKAEILGGMLPMIRDLIHEAINPPPRLTPAEVLARDQAKIVGDLKRKGRNIRRRAARAGNVVPGRAPLSAEERKARGERMAAGRKAARERREARVE